MTKILLIQPNYHYSTNEAEWEASTPIGLICLGTVLEEKHDVKIFDRNIPENDDKSLIKTAKNFNPDIVGITTKTGKMIGDAIHISKIIKQNSQAMVIWGGVHPTLRPEITLAHPSIDHIVRGEGEAALLDIADHYEKNKDISKIMNVDLNPMRPFVDLNKIPLPNYELVDVAKYSSIDIVTARGCPYRCKFCYNDAFWGKLGMKRWRSYSAERTIEFITTLADKYKNKRKRFAIHDDDFAIDKRRAIEICNSIVPLDLNFFCFLRVNDTTDEMMRALKGAGCWSVQFGLESGSQRILDFIQKDSTIEQNAHAIKQARKFRIFSEGAFIIGLPTETIDDLLLTVKFIHKYPPDVLHMADYRLYPSTHLYNYCIEHGLANEPAKLEEWTNLNPQCGIVPVNVSEIPTEALINVYTRMQRNVMIRGYIKKFFRMIYERRMPSIKRYKVIFEYMLSLFGYDTYKKDKIKSGD